MYRGGGGVGGVEGQCSGQCDIKFGDESISKFQSTVQKVQLGCVCLCLDFTAQSTAKVMLSRSDTHKHCSWAGLDLLSG